METALQSDRGVLRRVDLPASVEACHPSCSAFDLGNGVNLLIFTSGRLTREIPPIIPDDLAVSVIPSANPLPQALVLTAIVISFSFFAFLLVLGYRAYQTLGTDDTEGMRLAAPEGEELPPLGY